MALTEVTNEMAKTVQAGIDIVGLPAKAKGDSMNERDPHNNDPVGPLAVIKARMLSWLFRRARSRHPFV